MAKSITVYRCTHCDSQFPKWEGKCRECGSWGTLIEAQEAKKPVSSARSFGAPAKVLKASTLHGNEAKRTPTGIQEFDRVLGGGLVKGAVYLVGGDPGVGKSTLLLQLLDTIHVNSLYVSGEESTDQISGRIKRLNIQVEKTGFISETNLETILATIADARPDVVIIDSINTMHDETIGSEPGSVSQIKTVTAKLVEIAKQQAVTMCIVGHVTKSGSVAGPKTLEHLVDAVLYVEGDEHGLHRIVRSTKNRFGSVNEIGVFTLDDRGFHEAKNPSQIFIKSHQSPVSGSVITPVVEGSRVFFLEYQALLSYSKFGYPVRKAIGFDPNRLSMLLAVMNKRLHISLEQYDIHINVEGGMKLLEPSCDLAVIAALVSAFKNVPVPDKTILFGEVGLAGEVRPVAHDSKRIIESSKLGFHPIICPLSEATDQRRCIGVSSVQDAISQIWKNK